MTSPDFRAMEKVGDVQPASGYFYWDNVHPTTRVHAIIAEEVEKRVRVKYLIKSPNVLANDEPEHLFEVPRFA